jgi:flagellar motor component MotA
MDIVFLSWYTFEAVMKVIAMGFIFNSNSYLRDLWNVLDFIIIVSAYIPYFFSNNTVNLNALRSLRVLRPLRTISSVKSLRSIMMTLFASFAELGNSLLILGFTYTIFAIAGL